MNIPSHISPLLSKSTKVLAHYVPLKNVSKLIIVTQRCFIHNKRSKKNSIPYKELKYAIFGGTLLISYSYMSGYLSSETITGIKHYSNLANSQNTSNSSSHVSSETNTISLLSDKEVTARLRNMEQSYFVNRGKGILRYDISQLPSNNPIEDNRIEQIITVPNELTQSLEDFYFFGVFDGHGGPYTSTKLSYDLVPYVAYQLGQVYSQGNESLTSQAIDDAIIQGFMKLDKDIVENSLSKLFENPTKKNLVESLPAISGSCALLALFDSNNCTLKVAVSGDSRAIIVSTNDMGQWFVKPLSVDQTGDNPTEVQRIHNEHPGEPNCIKNGRILGSLQPSRAFGDCRYKIKDLNGKSPHDLPDHLKIYFRKEPRNFLTPSYVTAKPEITTTQVDKYTKFMVIGSDGLFELLSNEEIASLVIKWMETYPLKKGYNTLNPSPKGKLPPVDNISLDKNFQIPALRYKTGKKSQSEYILEDVNVSTHLIRNALSGGGNKEYVSTLVSIPSPMSRKYRDDLTVTVVFFGNEKDEVNGQLQINQEATKLDRSKL